jgi:hypothetical protein
MFRFTMHPLVGSFSSSIARPVPPPQPCHSTCPAERAMPFRTSRRCRHNHLPANSAVVSPHPGPPALDACFWARPAPSCRPRSPRQSLAPWRLCSSAARQRTEADLGLGAGRVRPEEGSAIERLGAGFFLCWRIQAPHRARFGAGLGRPAHGMGQTPQACRWIPTNARFRPRGRSLLADPCALERNLHRVTHIAHGAGA